MDAKVVGQNIMRLRKSRKMTQKDLANQLNVIDKTISRWECGYGFPEVSLIPKIAEVLGVGVSDILGEGEIKIEDKPKPKKKNHVLVLSLSIGLTVLLATATGFIIGANLTPKLDYPCWELLKKDDAKDEFITAFGQEEVVSLSLYDNKTFLAHETWKESSLGSLMNCQVKGRYEIEGDKIYFKADKQIDPLETDKLHTCNKLGLEHFVANVNLDGEKIFSIVFNANEKNSETSLFGRWTKFANYFSKKESEITFEKVNDSSLNESQLARMPSFVIEEMKIAFPMKLEASLNKNNFVVGDRLSQSDYNVSLLYGNGEKDEVTSIVKAGGKYDLLLPSDDVITFQYEEEEITKSTSLPVNVTYLDSWKIPSLKRSKVTYFTHFITQATVSFATLELYEDGNYLYVESYGLDKSYTNGVSYGTYKRISCGIEFVSVATVTNNEDYRRLLTSKQSSLSKYTSTYVDERKGLLFHSSPFNRNIFGFYAGNAIIKDTSFVPLDASLDINEGDVYFEKLEEGALSPRAISVLNEYYIQI